jgi:hypothetical protein
MDAGYWIGRKRAAMGMARDASSAEARLIHYQLAGLYSVKAVRAPALPIFAAAPESAADQSDGPHR